MNALILTLIISVVASALETMFRYLRDHHTREWSMRPIVVGAVCWAVALFIVQLYRFSLGTTAMLINSGVGGLVWYGVASLVGRVLWRSTRRSSGRR